MVSPGFSPSLAAGIAHLLLTSTEEFSTQLEEFASHLVLENQTLTYENKQLNILLKDYENVLEGVMGKFRSVSVCVVSFTYCRKRQPVETLYVHAALAACLDETRAFLAPILYLAATQFENSTVVSTAAGQHDIVVVAATPEHPYSNGSTKCEWRGG